MWTYYISTLTTFIPLPPPLYSRKCKKIFLAGVSGRLLIIFKKLGKINLLQFMLQKCYCAPTQDNQHSRGQSASYLPLGKQISTIQTAKATPKNDPKNTLKQHPKTTTERQQRNDRKATSSKRTARQNYKQSTIKQYPPQKLPLGRYYIIYQLVEFWQIQRAGRGPPAAPLRPQGPRKYNTKRLQ